MLPIPPPIFTASAVTTRFFFDERLLSVTNAGFCPAAKRNVPR